MLAKRFEANNPLMWISMKKKIVVLSLVLTLWIAITTIGNPVVNAQADQLVGTWRLISSTRQLVDTEEAIDTLGQVSGFLHYGLDGRMLVIIVKANRPKPSDPAKMTDRERVELFNTMLAYGGKFKFDGKTVTHDLDISWNENWTGTSQVRHVRFEGRRLILTTNPQPGFDGKRGIGVLTWEKLE
jgi:hypothetical protein